jgi:hypothetical protein
MNPQKLQNFIDNLIIHDYLLFGGSFVLFILLLALAIILRRKLVLAILLILLSFSILLLGPTLGYIQLHAFLFSNKATVTEMKALEFTDALVVWGDLNNTSKRPFSSCSVTAGVFKVSGNALLDSIYPLNPFKKSTIIVEDIGVGASKPFKVIVEPFTYAKDYNVTVGAKCK